jgi:hypothetical protein
VKPPAKHIDRPAVGIVGRVRDKLIANGEVRRGGQAVAVICLENLLESGMRQLSVANEDAQTSGVEERLVDAGNAVDGAGDADGIVGPGRIRWGQMRRTRN